ncbi:MAG: cellulase family glycosylhydrolase [Clostridiales bacterium]|nr:cellulase family glycosylhydrolase [Clostridiales bacterium]
MNRKWTEKEANAWYDALPWLRGCNFIGSDCASRIDMWQSYGAKEHFATAERELALAEKIGFNTVRLLVEFDVWYQEHDAFMENLERYIALSASHGLSAVIALANEAVLSRGEFSLKTLGEQSYALGYHQGRLPLTPEQAAKPAVHPLEVEPWKSRYLDMVKEIVTKYRSDSRVIMWNVYNEPGIIIGERVLPLLTSLFETVRACDPIQPLAADVWHPIKDGEIKNPIDKAAFELSDVISFHSYTAYRWFVPQIEALKKLDRPIFLTEWLNRISHNDVREIYPLLYLEKIACHCWGFVVGKTQTNEPWDSLWEQYENGTHPDLDFTKWQHDLFRPSLHPYDPHEIELITEYNALADVRDRQKL